MVIQDGQQPPLPSLPRALTVETTVHQDPGEPDFE